MKYIFLFVFVWGASSTVSGQVTKFIVTDTSRSMGRNVLTGQPITGIEYSFEDPVIGFHLDTIANYVTLQLRGLTKNEKFFQMDGRLVRYDVALEKFKWSKRIMYASEGVELFKGVTIFYRLGKAHILDPLTGLPTSEVKNSIFEVSSDGRVGFGYKVSSGVVAKDKVEGFRLDDGEKLWKREISRSLGWNSIVPVDDSSVIAAASGLHKINLFTGDGWDYSAVTGELDYTGVALKNGIMIAAALLTGIYAGTVDPKLVKDVCSNILMDSSRIYFAGKENIACLNKNGGVLWKKELPKEMTSRSSLFLFDDQVIMLNTGHANFGPDVINYGVPFIASFDQGTGEQNYLEKLTTNKAEYIKGKYLMEGDLTMIGKTSLTTFDLNERTIGKTVAIDTSGFGELVYFIGDKVFVEKDSLFQNLIQVDSSKFYLFTKSLKTLVLNRDLEIEKSIPYDDLHLHYESKHNLKFISNSNTTHVIDSNGRRVLQLEGSGKSGLIGSTFFSPLEKGMLMIDLEEELKKFQ